MRITTSLGALVTAIAVSVSVLPTGMAHADDSVLVCDGGSTGGSGSCTVFAVGMTGTLTMRTSGYGYAGVDCYADPALTVWVGGAFLERTTSGTCTARYDRFTYVSYCYAYGYRAVFTAT